MSAAFDVVFAVFVALILGLAVIAVRWAVRRDRAERARRLESAPDPTHRGAPGPPSAASSAGAAPDARAVRPWPAARGGRPAP